MEIKVVTHNKVEYQQAEGKLFDLHAPVWRIHLHLAFRFKDQNPIEYRKEHLWQAIKILYPVYYRRDNYYIDHFFSYALSDQYETYGIIGPGGFGKTTMEALFAILSWVEDPKNTIVICGTTTEDSAEDRIWGVVKEMFELNEEKFSSFAKVTGKRIYYREKRPDGTWSVNKKRAMFITALPTGEGNVKAILKGIHAPRVYLFFDEYNESAPAHTVFPNLRRACKDFKAFVTGNPTDRYDALGLVCEPKELGWEGFKPLKVKSIKESCYESTIYKGCVLYFPGFLNPRIHYSRIEGENYDGRFNYFTSLEEIKREKEMLSHSEFMEQLIGFFPETAMGDRNYILEPQDVHANKVNLPALWSGMGQKKLLMGCDPAVTVGGDESIIRTAEMGILAEGYEGLGFTSDIISFKIPKGLTTNKYEWLYEEIMRYVRKFGIQPQHFVIDANTYTNNLVENLKHGWSQEILAINSQSAPSDTPIYAGRDKTAKDDCDRRVSELWFLFRKFVLSGQIKGLDPLTISEMTKRSYEIRRGGKASVETKTDFKKRLSSIGVAGKSPDRSDCATMILDLARRIGLRLVHPGDRHKGFAVVDNTNFIDNQKEFLLRESISSDLDLYEIETVGLDGDISDWYEDDTW